MEGKLIKNHYGFEYFLMDEKGETIATSESGKLSIKNCEAVVNGYDLDELTNRAFDYMGYHSTVTPHEEKQFKLGYRIAFREALEILGDKKFSEFLDKEKELGISDIKTIERIQWYYNTYFDKSQQTEWDVEIEMEKEVGTKLHDDGREFFMIDGTKPKLDENGCLILRRC